MRMPRLGFWKGHPDVNNSCPSILPNAKTKMENKNIAFSCEPLVEKFTGHP
jgi:hypothetical protein